MTGNDTTIMNEFEGKLHLLIHEYRQKSEQNMELARQIEEKENILKELQMRCAALESSYNNRSTNRCVQFVISRKFRRFLRKVKDLMLFFLFFCSVTYEDCCYGCGKRLSGVRKPSLSNIFL